MARVRDTTAKNWGGDRLDNLLTVFGEVVLVSVVVISVLEDLVLVVLALVLLLVASRLERRAAILV